jgi:lipoprotein-releasing system permease protein
VGDSLSLWIKASETDSCKLSFLVWGIYEAPDEPTLQRTVFVHWQRINDLNQKLPAQISGFEVFIDNIDDLDIIGKHLYSDVLSGKDEYAVTLKEMEPGIFDWLNLTDMNERIITILMILVAIINMSFYRTHCHQLRSGYSLQPRAAACLAAGRVRFYPSRTPPAQ